jgi:hypothetical protein
VNPSGTARPRQAATRAFFSGCFAPIRGFPGAENHETLRFSAKSLTVRERRFELSLPALYKFC